ncbi:MAG: trehalose-phosphatase [bacterium]
MRYLLLLDYDGTLAPIKKHPKLARLSPPRKTFLRQLAKHPKIKIAVISGRKLSDLKKMIGLPKIIYVGNHGFEIEINGKHKTHPAARKIIPTLKRIKAILANKLKVKGAWVEDKDLTLTIHYRQAAKKRLKEFYQLFDQLTKPWQGKIKITKGKKVFEIRSPFDWDKGKAVEWLIAKLKMENYLPIYIGDDKTDEDAFIVLKGRGKTIHVGNGKTLAETRVKNISGVYGYLRGLYNDAS